MLGMSTKTPRESRYVKAARLAYELARESVPRYTHPKSPHRFTQPQLVACVLLMFYLDLSYRDMEDWLLASDKVCAALELKQIPDHSTLARTFRRLRVVELTRMRDALLRQMWVEEEGGRGRQHQLSPLARQRLLPDPTRTAVPRLGEGGVRGGGALAPDYWLGGWTGQSP